MSRSSPTTVNTRALGIAVLAGMALAGPALVGAQVLDSTVDDPGAWSGLIVAVIVSAFGVAGFVAAGRSGGAPLLHGPVAAVATYAVVQTLAILRLSLTGGDITWRALPLLALVAAAAGLIGTVVAGTRGRP